MNAPAHLSAAARAVWVELAPAFVGDRFDEAEGPALEAYCVQVARMRDAQTRIDAEGLVVADEKGRPVPHPALMIEKQAQSEVRAWVSRYRRR